MNSSSSTEVPAATASHRAALEAAIAAMPSVDDDSWEVPAPTLKAAGMQDDVATARKAVLQFAMWAREAITRLPHAPPTAFEATDFNDYYKIVMSRVQFVYAQAQAGTPADQAPSMPLCSFQTQLRRRPVFRKAGEESCSCVFDVTGSYTPRGSIKQVGSFESSSAALRQALTAVGARTFTAETLRGLLRDRAPKAAGIEDSLTPTNDAWIAALDGRALFTLLPEGADFSNGDDVEVKIIVDGGVATFLANGPWFRVTFCETPLLQCMSQFFTDSVCSVGDDDGAAWCREAMCNFATTAHHVKAATPEGAFSLFSGRRAPHPPFHLLQHMYLKEVLGGMATSSLFAGRVLGKADMPQPLIGTLAHEGPMGFMCLHPELDERLPLSSLLWHLLFWGMTANHTVLPDGHGSATFKAMLTDLGLVEQVAMARQDSGKLARFAAIFSTTRKMASEIENFGDVEEALGLGYIAFGAGGFFGEKRRAFTEFSLAAKITKATSIAPDGEVRVGFAAKLGDCSENATGSWAEYNADSALPAKFIVSPEADRMGMWRRMLAYGAKGDAWFDAQTAGESPKPLVKKAEAMALAAALRKLATSPAMAGDAYSAMTGRISALAETVEGAAEALE